MLFAFMGILSWNAQAELILVSGKSKQKNYIDTSNVSVSFNPKVVTYDQLIFIGKNDPLNSWRNSVIVKTLKMNCDKKNWFMISEIRKSWDRSTVIEKLPNDTNPVVHPVIDSGPVKFVYDKYCR